MPRAHATRPAQDTVFGYELEPVDERPSEFRTTTTYETVSGLVPFEVRRHARSRPAPRVGAKAMILSIVVLAGVCGWALQWVVALLRH